MIMMHFSISSVRFFFLLPSFGVRKKVKQTRFTACTGWRWSWWNGLQGRQANRHVLNGVASGYNKPAPKTYGRVAVPANERGLVNSHELPSLPIHSLQTLDWCTSFNSFHMMKGLTSRLPKPLTRTTNFRICNSLSKRRDYLMPWVGH